MPEPIAAEAIWIEPALAREPGTFAADCQVRSSRLTLEQLYGTVG